MSSTKEGFGGETSLDITEKNQKQGEKKPLQTYTVTLYGVLAPHVGDNNSIKTRTKSEKSGKMGKSTCLHCINVIADLQCRSGGLGLS